MRLRLKVDSSKFYGPGVWTGSRWGFKSIIWYKLKKLLYRVSNEEHKLYIFWNNYTYIWCRFSFQQYTCKQKHDLSFVYITTNCELYISLITGRLPLNFSFLFYFICLTLELLTIKPEKYFKPKSWQCPFKTILPWVH